MRIFTKRTALGMALAATLFAPAAAAQPVGNAENGAKVFRKCQACHKVGPDAKNGVGPALNGVAGREAGGLPDYPYSAALTASALAWDDETLAKYLHDPRSFVPRTKMAYPGLKSDQDIADVIEYLKQFDADGHTPE